MHKELQKLVETYLVTKKEIDKNAIIKFVDKNSKHLINKSPYGSRQFIKSRLAFDDYDIQQECLIVLCKSLETYNKKLCDCFYAYFMNNFRMRIKQLCTICNAKKRNDSSMCIDELESRIEQGDLEITFEFLPNKLAIDLELLPEKESFVLKKSVNGFTYREIAKELGTNVMDIYKTKNNAIELLK